MVDPSGTFMYPTWTINDACDLESDTISAIIDLLTNESDDLSALDVLKELGVGFIDGFLDGVNIAVGHDEETIEKYGAVGTFSNISGYVGEGALALATGAVIWQAAGGATMDIAIGTIGESVHLAYGTEGSWLHAVGPPGNMHSTFDAAASFAENAWQLTGIPIMSSGGLLFTYADESSNCALAVWNGYVSSGGAALGAGAIGTTVSGFIAIDWIWDDDEQ